MTDTLAWTARVLFPANERAPFVGRRLISTMLMAWGYAQQVELAELVVSELVSNAVRYAGDAGDLELEVIADDQLIRLSIADGSDERPVLNTSSPGQPGGMGLQLVDRVATRWGVQDHLLGKRVWVELPAQPAAVSAGGS